MMHFQQVGARALQLRASALAKVVASNSVEEPKQQQQVQQTCWCMTVLLLPPTGPTCVLQRFGFCVRGDRFRYVVVCVGNREQFCWDSENLVNRA